MCITGNGASREHESTNEDSYDISYPDYKILDARNVGGQRGRPEWEPWAFSPRIRNYYRTAAAVAPFSNTLMSGRPEWK